MDVTFAAVIAISPAIVAQAVLALSNQHIALMLAIVAASVLLLTSTRRRIRRAQNSPQAYTREQLSRLRNEQSLAADIEELMAELEQFARQLQARIDTRFAKLEAVVRDADKQIDRLERLLRRAEGAPTLDVTVGGAGPGAEPPPETADDPRHQAIYRLADAGLTPRQIAQELGQSIGEVELILALRKASGGVAAAT